MNSHPLYIITIVLAGLSGCGSRTGISTDEAARREPFDAGPFDAGPFDAGPFDECALPSAVRGVRGTLGESSCALEGRSPDGRTHRVVCERSGTLSMGTFEGCRWITNGVTVCECDTPDWATSCGNGVPLCAFWNAPFDFASDVTFDE